MGKARHALNLAAFAMGATTPSSGPIKATWEVTYRCNSRCKHCHLWQSTNHDELSTDEAKSFIRELADLGTIHLSFSGGEPLLRKDILELVSYARDCKLTTGMNTNGALLASPDRARALCQSGIGTVYISLDGADAETHNVIRGQDSAFSSALKAIDNLIEHRVDKKPRVFINTTVMRDNVLQLDGILALCKEHGVDGMTMSVIQSVDIYSPDQSTSVEKAALEGLSETLCKLSEKSGGLIPHSREYLNSFRTYLEQPEDLYKYRCVAGFSTVLIHPDGEVQPCPASFARMGSLKELSFRDIWFSPEAKRIRGLIKENEHPICWFDCVAPLTLLAHDIRKLHVGNLLHKKTLRHILNKLSK